MQLPQFWSQKGVGAAFTIFCEPGIKLFFFFFHFTLKKRVHCIFWDILGYVQYVWVLPVVCWVPQAE